MSRQLFTTFAKGGSAAESPKSYDKDGRSAMIDTLFASMAILRGSIPATGELLSAFKDPPFQNISAGGLIRAPETTRVVYAKEGKGRDSRFLNYYLTPDGEYIEYSGAPFRVPQLETWMHLGNYLVRSLAGIQELTDAKPTINIFNKRQGRARLSINLAIPRPGQRAERAFVSQTVNVNS